jgi:type II secretory pathway pseudopilin PulG
LAVVLVIVALLVGGLVIPLSSQMDMRARQETRASLETIRDALLGYAAANGRLPCPASTTSAGVESPLGGGTCTNPYDGFVPAATLGIGPTDSAGYAVDGWGNRLRYAVTTAKSNAFTATAGLQSSGLGSVANAADLMVCSAGPAMGSGGSAGCPAGATALANSAVAVLISPGHNPDASGTDQAENQDSPGNRVFVSHDASVGSSPGGEFDDIVLWLAPSVLFNRMVAAGRLP